MAQVKIEDIPFNKLLDYAQSLQLDARKGVTSRAELNAMVRAVHGGAEAIEFALDDAPVESVAKQITSNAELAHYRHDPKVTVNIASDDMNGGSHPFPIGCNGVPIWVRRDEDVDIPFRFYLVLQNAIEKDFETYTDPVTGLMKEREFERHAIRFTVKKMPSDEEIAAFHERTKNVKSGTLRMAA